MEKSSAGTASTGHKGTTQTTHITVKENKLTKTSTSDGSAASNVKVAY